MRAISMLLMAALLFTGCGSYYQKVNRDSTVHPNPRSYFDIGDEALLELRDGGRVAGEVDAIRTDSITIDGEVIQWSEVATVGKSKYRTAATLALVAVVAVGVIALVAIGDFLSDPGFGFPAD
jgi:hypothetical protein